MNWLTKSMENELLHSNKLLYAANKRIDELEQALAEKDREIQQIREHEFQGGYREAEAILEKKYQKLMEQTVRFAQIICNDRACTYGGPEAAHQASLVYRTAEAFLKERGQ